MMRRRSLLQIDDSISRQRRVAVQQRTSISTCAGSPYIDLIDITTELTPSPTLCGSSVTMMQPADLRDCDDLALLRRFDPSLKWRVPLQCLMRARIVITDVTRCRSFAKTRFICVFNNFACLSPNQKSR